jgi:hypothetical protein
MDNKWARLLAYAGLVNQALLLQNEYLAAENRILKARTSRDTYTDFCPKKSKPGKRAA